MPPPSPDYEASSAGYGAAGYGGGPVYAEWPIRVVSALIDYVVPGIIAGAVFQVNKPIGWVLYLVALVWAFYQAYLGGSTGQSYGKKIVGTRVVAEATGQTIGGGTGIGRYVLHILDALPCYLGYLWPLWDSKKQTFADKIVKSVVVKG
jgi:uncharacterized RDD family membrane protein YckC